MDNAKKILFILPSLSIGGLERMQVTIANALVKKGHDVTVMILENQTDLKADLDERVRLIYKPYKPHPIMKKIPYVRHKFYDDGMWETRASAKTLYKYYVGKEKYDVEIGFFRGLSVKIISGSTNKTSVKLAWVHSDFKTCYGITANFKNMDAVKMAYGKLDKIVCVSKQAKESFIEVVGQAEKTVAIYNMVAIDEIIKKAQEEVDLKKSENPLLISVGRLVAVKGYDRLLNVAERLNQDGFKFDLWIVGGGGDEEKLKSTVSQKNLSNVKLLGQQSNPYKYIKQADLYVCSSLYEGYNLTVAEALLLDVPVLSTKCTGPCEILDGGRYGILVENSEEGLYQGIKDLLENPDKLAYYKERAKERKDFFDEDKIVKQIEELFGK